MDRANLIAKYWQEIDMKMDYQDRKIPQLVCNNCGHVIAWEEPVVISKQTGDIACSYDCMNSIFEIKEYSVYQLEKRDKDE